MLIGVISDTHDNLPSHALKLLTPADEIWHLGDVCQPSIIPELESLDKPLTIVKGNCDWIPQWHNSITLTRGGLDFHLVHIPPYNAPSGCHAVLHGHTHVPRDETIDGVRFFNPGSAGSANRGAPASVATLEVAEGEIKDWTIHLVLG